MLNRRDFLGAVAASVTIPALRGQTPAAGEWGSPIFDLHHHMRGQAANNLAHIDGAGIAKANLLTRAAGIEQVKVIQTAAPDRFVSWFGSADVARPETIDTLTQAARAGARGFGEMKYHVAADSPEFKRAYALAGELGIPILVHFQEVDHFPNEGTWATGYAANFEAILKAYPTTNFIGHADAFWANVSADYRNEAAYPSGPIVRGGVTDKLLGDYPNLYGDLAANSGNNALSRDADFTRDFLSRHQNKLIFGSDCSCADGRGAGTGQANNPAASRMAGKCVARETLTVLKRSTTPEVFRKLTWDNAHKLLTLP
jgi:predicted TIM-barrel fold metal-dependent hydrolase